MCSQDSAQFTYGGYSICYGSSNVSALGPYDFRGVVQWSPPFDCGPIGSNCSQFSGGDNNHQGIVEYPAGSGRFLFAYHTRKIARERGQYIGYQRNIGLDALYFTGPGEAGFPLPPSLPWLAGSGPGIVPVTATPSWLRMAKWLDPFALQRAVTTAYMSPGLDSEPCSEGGLNLGFLSNASYTIVRGADFGAAGASSITFRVATPLAGGVISVLLGRGPGLDSSVVATCLVPNTGTWQAWANVTCAISPPVTGVRDVTFLFTGLGDGGLFNVVTWQCSGGAVSGDAPPPVTVLVAIRASSNGMYVQASSDPNSNGALTPSGAASSPMDASLLFVLVDSKYNSQSTLCNSRPDH